MFLAELGNEGADLVTVAEYVPDRWWNTSCMASRRNFACLFLTPGSWSPACLRTKSRARSKKRRTLIDARARGLILPGGEGLTST
jgi:hypothetical protein